MKSIDYLAKKIHISISNEQYYILALTHPSCNSEANTKHYDYERLEYIGDAVLGYVCADIVFKKHPEMEPGDLSKLRSYLVRSESLANYAKKISLQEFIKTGNSISKDQISSSNKILEDVFEALIGAIYLDQNIQVAYNFCYDFLIDGVMNTDLELLTDAKTKLQEELQAEHRENVHYEVINTSGPAHNRIFTVNVMFNDIVLAQGKGKSKKSAEEDAAKNALLKRSV